MTPEELKAKVDADPYFVRACVEYAKAKMASAAEPAHDEYNAMVRAHKAAEEKFMLKEPTLRERANDIRARYNVHGETSRFATAVIAYIDKTEKELAESQRHREEILAANRDYEEAYEVQGNDLAVTRLEVNDLRAELLALQKLVVAWGEETGGYPYPRVVDGRPYHERLKAEADRLKVAGVKP